MITSPRPLHERRREPEHVCNGCAHSKEIRRTWPKYRYGDAIWTCEVDDHGIESLFGECCNGGWERDGDKYASGGYVSDPSVIRCPDGGLF